MYFLYIATGIALLISLIANREKTFTAIKISVKKFVKILPSFLIMFILVSVILFVLPDTVISRYLSNNNKYFGILIASFLGSITLMSGFIAYPLCGILLKKGVTFYRAAKNDKMLHSF